MKIRKRLGSDAVQDLVNEATERAKELPGRSVRDEWPPSQRVISDAFTPAIESDLPSRSIIDIQELHWPARIWSKQFYSSYCYFTGRTATVNIGGRFYAVAEYSSDKLPRRAWFDRTGRFVTRAD